MRNRWYDPATGRFLSEDPIGLEGGINLYAFAGGDPINFSDPFGLEALTEEEKQKLGWLCQQADCDAIEVFRGNDSRLENALRRFVLRMSQGRPVALGNFIFLGDGDRYDFATKERVL